MSLFERKGNQLPIVGNPCLDNCKAACCRDIFFIGLSKPDILNIDKFELDRECTEISNIYDMVGELVSYLEAERDSTEIDKNEIYSPRSQLSLNT